MNFKAVLTLGLFFSFSIIAKENACDSECKLNQVETYFNKIDRIFKKGSTDKDINNFLAHVHDDVKYEHLEYQAEFTKEKWKKAFARQRTKGSYSNGPEDEARVMNVIYGKNHAAVEYSYGKLDSEGVWQEGTPYFALFGFTEGKISLIREYW